jgi:hypothetical protein
MKGIIEKIKKPGFELAQPNSEKLSGRGAWLSDGHSPWPLDEHSS